MSAAFLDRIKDFRRVPASTLRANPKNFREHPESQKKALTKVLKDIGYADCVVCREDADGSLIIIDGHLRAEVGKNQLIPCLVLDVNETEANTLLMAMDPIAAMANQNDATLANLIGSLDAAGRELAELIHGKPEEPTTGSGEGAIEPKFSILVDCDSEAQQADILAELSEHQLRVKAISVGWSEPPAAELSTTQPLAPGEIKIVRECRVAQTPRVLQCQGMFDVPAYKKLRQEWRVNITLDKPWHIGLIVGPSGSGKTTLARELFGRQLVAGWPWPEDQSILDGFPEHLATSEIVGLLSSVGFSSPPSWLKPFHVLSNGEQFRVNLARTLAEQTDLAVVDEFTSVVDRTVAQIGSAALAKTIRATNRRFVAVGCHYDIEDWLQPDWKYDTATGQFSWRLLRPRPQIQLQIQRVAGRDYWPRFRGHHYLSSDINKSAHAYVASVQLPGQRPQPAAFTAVLSMAGAVNPRWREHRTVCLPDFQGVGIGNAMSAFVGSLYVATGKKYNSTTSHPAMIRHRLKSPLWRMVRKPEIAAPSATDRPNNRRATDRITAGFEYIGPARPDDARAFGLKVPPLSK